MSRGAMVAAAVAVAVVSAVAGFRPGPSPGAGAGPHAVASKARAAQPNGIVRGAMVERGSRLRLTLAPGRPKRPGAVAVVRPPSDEGEAAPVLPPKNPAPPPDGRPQSDGLPRTAASRRTSHATGATEVFDVRTVATSAVATVRGGALPIASLGEPMPANDRNALMVVGNDFAAISSDNGRTYRYWDPNVELAQPLEAGGAAASAGFCCDQLAFHIDRGDHSTLLWLSQFSEKSGGGNALKLMWFRHGRDDLVDLNASSSTVESFACTMDVSAADIGEAGGKLDYSQVGETDEFVYFTTNINRPSPKSAATFIWRIAKDDLDDSDCSVSIPYWIDQKTNIAPVRNGKDRMVLATQTTVGGGDKLRVYSVEGDSRQMDVTTVNITNFPNRTKEFSCPTPDGGNPCGFLDSRIQGAFRSGDTLGFLWTAAQGDGFDFPQVRVALLDADTFEVVGERTIYNPDFAFAWPAVDVNTGGKVGVMMQRIGGGQYPSPRVFVVDDPRSGWDGDLGVVQVDASSGGSGDDRWGDFFSVRPYDGCGSMFMGTYSLQTAPANDLGAQAKAVWFGQADKGCADLVVDKVTAAGAPPVIVTAGRKLAVSVVTANAGFARTKVTRTAVYLSADEVKDDSDRKLDGASYVGELDPQEVDKSDDAPRTLRLGVAPVTRTGAYFLIACADNKQRQDEIDEDNCLTSQAPVIVNSPRRATQTTADLGVDLTVPSGPALSARRSRSLAVTATVRRAGPLGPALSSPLRFTLSPVPGRDDDEVPLALKGGERRGIASGPAADRRQSREATLTIPAGLAPGRWWVRACPAPRARPRLGARVACATSARPLVVR